MSTLIDEVRSNRLPPARMAKAIREAAGVTQERLALELGVHRITVVRWERGTSLPHGELRGRYARLLLDLQSELAA